MPSRKSSDHTEKSWPRAILHVDMDAFFAAVEQLDHPEYRGKPVIIGGRAEHRGVVSTASYEARKFGVHSAMPTARAKALCPKGIFLPVRMHRYAEVSGIIHEIFTHYTPKVLPLSVDEAFLDITGSQRLFGPPRQLSMKLKQEILDSTGLTASVGVAPCLFVAKVASDLQKPDGLVLVPEEKVLDTLAPLPVGRIWGVGKVMQKHLNKLGIETISQLRSWPLKTLQENFGNTGDHLYNLARGIDDREVTEPDAEKSVSNETTFAEDVTKCAELEKTLLALADKVATRCRAADLAGRVVQIKLRYSDFSTVTRRITLATPVCTGQVLFRHGVKLLREKTEAGSRPVRLIGIGLSNFNAPPATQGDLFNSHAESGKTSADETDRKSEKAERALDRIREKLGDDMIGRGSLLLEPDDE